jgi:hypothetical protein
MPAWGDHANANGHNWKLLIYTAMGESIETFTESKHVPDQNPATAAERLTSTLLTTFLAAYGWFTLLQGGIDLRGKSGRITYAEGGFALGVAVGAFLFAALCALLMVRAFGWGRLGAVLLLAALLVPPLAFNIMR